MSEIQVVIPLSLIESASDLSPAEIARVLNNAVSLQGQVNFHKERTNQIASQMRSAAGSLQLILDEVDNEFEKVKALRNFAAELKETAAKYRELS